jgi:branched-chain amino acid transport system ATP-binding protein
MNDIVLATKGLTKRFGALSASENITLDLREGEIHAIIGPNGAGKSTFIAQVCGSLKSDSGTVHFLGRDVTQETTRSRAQAGLARSFQISALATEDSVLQNVLLGALGASRNPWRFFQPALSDLVLVEQAEHALYRVGLSDYASKRTSELSHGQRRQLEVAIALTLSPKAFVMDEPMAGLGSEGSVQMTVFLDKLRKEAPIFLVEHDMDAVFALADRISVLVYGKVIATGTVEEIRADLNVRDAYLGEEE